MSNKLLPCPKCGHIPDINDADFLHPVDRSRTSDLRQQNGLTCAVDKLRHLDGVSVIEFTLDDIVRHGIVKDILVAWG